MKKSKLPTQSPVTAPAAEPLPANTACFVIDPNSPAGITRIEWQVAGESGQPRIYLPTARQDVDSLRALALAMLCVALCRERRAKALTALGTLLVEKERGGWQIKSTKAGKDWLQTLGTAFENRSKKDAKGEPAKELGKLLRILPGFLREQTTTLAWKAARGKRGTQASFSCENPSLADKSEHVGGPNLRFRRDGQPSDLATDDLLPLARELEQGQKNWEPLLSRRATKPPPLDEDTLQICSALNASEFTRLIQALVRHQGQADGFSVGFVKGGACWVHKGNFLELTGSAVVNPRWMDPNTTIDDAIVRQLQSEVKTSEFPSQDRASNVVLVLPVNLSQEQVERLQEAGSEFKRRVRIVLPEEWMQWLRACPPLLARYLPREAAQRPDANGFSGKALKSVCALYRELDLPQHRDLRLIGVSTRLAQQRYEAGTIPLERVFVPQKFVLSGENIAQAKRLQQLLGTPRPKVLLGDPGSGKTTILHYLALSRAGETESGGHVVPLFLSLRDFSRGRKERPAFVEAFADQARTLSMAAGDAHPWYFQALLEMGEAIVLLDGLDEAGDETARTQLARLIEAFQREYPLCPLWVTSRIVGYSGAARLDAETFEHFEVAPFGAEERRVFVTRWFEAEFPARQAERKDHTETLLSALDVALPQVQELAGNPLLLTLMVLIHRQRQHLPESRGELYDEAVEMLLHQREKDRFRGEPTPLERLQPPIDANEARRYLTTIAWAAQKANEKKEAKERGNIPRTLILDELVPLRALKRGGDKDAARADIEVFLDYIRARTGLLNWRGQDTYAFVHLSFQEHLAARKLADDRSKTEKDMCNFFFQSAALPAWRETALLLLYRLQATTGDIPFLDLLMTQARRREQAGTPLGDALWRTLGMAVRDNLNFLPSDADLILSRLLTAWFTKPKFEGETYAVLAQVSTFAIRRRAQLVALLRRWWQDPASSAQALAALHLRVRLLGWPAAEDAESQELAAELEARVPSGTDPAKDGPVIEQLGRILADAGPDNVAAHKAGARCTRVTRARLQARLIHPELPARARADAGIVLGHLGDPRPGVGVKNGLPALDWIEIPPGPFLMGSHKGETQWEDETPQFECKLITQPYRISRYPVTVAQYQAFVDAGGYADQARNWWTKDGWKWKADQKITGPEDYEPAFQTPNHPRVGVSWYEALAFCRWLSEQLGQRIKLPNEVEWERAARHTDARAYPWPDPEDKSKVADALAQRCNMSKTGIGHTSAVGMFPNGLAHCGAADMAGNVWEWTRSLFGKDPQKPEFGYPYTADAKREDLDAPAEIRRVLRGGSWNDGNPTYLRCSSRGRVGPVHRDQFHGFRCVWWLVGSAPRYHQPKAGRDAGWVRLSGRSQEVT